MFSMCPKYKRDERSVKVKTIFADQPVSLHTMVSCDLYKIQKNLMNNNYK